MVMAGRTTLGCKGANYGGRRPAGPCCERGPAPDYGRVRLTLVNGVLLGVMALAIVGIQGLYRGGAAVEASVRRYAAAVSNSDSATGLWPRLRPTSGRRGRSGFAASYLGNVYDVRGIAVRSPSVLQRVLDPTGGRLSKSPPSWTSTGTTRPVLSTDGAVAVEQVDGRWYLHAPFVAGRTT